MKIWLIAIVVVVLVGAAVFYLWLGRSASPEVSCSSLATKPVIVAFGDSLVAGYGAPDQQGFVGPLSQKIGVPILNAGVSGDTTGQALARLPDVLAQHPDIVIVLVGGNDALQRVSIDTTTANLIQILSTLKQNNIRTVLLGVQGGFISDPYASLFKNLAKEYATEYIPNILKGLIGNTSLMSDEVHPNAAGYNKIAEKIYPALNKTCAALSTQN
jgi:acyl-CoA thioesterase-1